MRFPVCTYPRPPEGGETVRQKSSNLPSVPPSCFIICFMVELFLYYVFVAITSRLCLSLSLPSPPASPRDSLLRRRRRRRCLEVTTLSFAGNYFALASFDLSVTVLQGGEPANGKFVEVGGELDSVTRCQCPRPYSHRSSAL